MGCCFVDAHNPEGVSGSNVGGGGEMCSGRTCDACLSDCVESLETWPGSISVLIRQLFSQSQGQISKPKMATSPSSFTPKRSMKTVMKCRQKANTFRQKQPLNLCLFQHPQNARSGSISAKQRGTRQKNWIPPPTTNR